MKRVKIFFAIAAASAMFLASCGEKCTTCTYSWEVDGQLTEIPQAEVCGKKGVIDDYKEANQASAEALAAFAGGENVKVTCVDN